MFKDLIKEEDDITDSQIRIVGTSTPFSADDMEDVLRENEREKDDDYIPEPEPVDTIPQPEPRPRRGCLFMAILLTVIVLGGIAAYIFISQHTLYEAPDTLSTTTFVPLPGKDSCYVEPTLQDTTDVKEITEACVTQYDTIINDIPLTIYTCNGGIVELSMQRPTADDPTLLMAAQAADVRSDIDAPAGAFVLHGELISKGHSKLGFCSIIRNHVTIGYARETPELESAIEQNGDFFRHYSLVCEGQLIEIPVKGKANRRALCILNDQVSIIQCNDRESYHDFAQALLDLNCREALALVGGESLLFYRDKESNQILTRGSMNCEANKKSENYIVWRKGE